MTFWLTENGIDVFGCWSFSKRSIPVIIVPMAMEVSRKAHTNWQLTLREDGTWCDPVTDQSRPVFFLMWLTFFQRHIFILWITLKKTRNEPNSVLGLYLKLEKIHTYAYIYIYILTLRILQSLEFKTNIFKCS